MATKKSKSLLDLIGKKKKSKKSESGERRELKLFEAMSNGEAYGDKELQRSAKDHLWMHFTRHSPYQTKDMTIITRGEGHYLWDSKGNKVIDGLSGLFAVNAGHGHQELADAAAKQMMELDAKVYPDGRPLDIVPLGRDKIPQ